jgi:hypothetical protein
LLRTLLELGHATSQNLDFAYRNGTISFGEETITEMNLLEIRRRHPDQVRIRTYPKARESAETGADWEWHIVGRRYTLKMRVQAKRVNKLGSIKGVAKRAPTSPLQQVDLLIRDAAKHKMRPVYCFYSSEAQRSIWTRDGSEEDRTAFEAGCLLSDARIVKRRMPKRLDQIEPWTVPWHYLWSRRLYDFSSGPYLVRFAESEEYRTMDQVWTAASVPDGPDASQRFPTVAELNEGLVDGTDATGIFQTRDVDLVEDYEPDAHRERGISLLIVVDVRFLDLMLRHFEPPSG